MNCWAAGKGGEGGCSLLLQHSFLVIEFCLLACGTRHCFSATSDLLFVAHMSGCEERKEEERGKEESTFVFAPISLPTHPAARAQSCRECSRTRNSAAHAFVKIEACNSF